MPTTKKIHTLEDLKKKLTAPTSQNGPRLKIHFGNVFQDTSVY